MISVAVSLFSEDDSLIPIVASLFSKDDLMIPTPVSLFSKDNSYGEASSGYSALCHVVFFRSILLALMSTIASTIFICAGP